MTEAVQKSLSAAEFRAACGLFPTGVTVVTRRMADGRPYGMTVSSFTSVSLEPPLILVCIDARAGFMGQLLPQTTFAVNVLREDQEKLAMRFARQPETGRFDEIAWTEGRSGVPLVHGTVASFTCTLHQSVPSGDHFILIGAVEEIRREEGRSLVWCQSAYHCLPTPVK